MSRKRSVMKPITDLWWRYCSTNRENLCTIAAKILWSSLFDTSNVNQVLMLIYVHDNFKLFLSKIWHLQFLINIESSYLLLKVV
jgi:hypothetical protein